LIEVDEVDKLVDRVDKRVDEVDEQVDRVQIFQLLLCALQSVLVWLEKNVLIELLRVRLVVQIMAVMER
jgi:hypothetical protein